MLLSRSFVPLTALFLSWGLAGCAPARLSTAALPVGAPRLAVQGQQGWTFRQRIRFGEFAVDSLDRSWVRGSSFEMGTGAPVTVGVGSAGQRYRFVLRDGAGASWRTTCDATHRRAGGRVAGVSVLVRDVLGVRCAVVSADGAGAGWTLSVAEAESDPAAGRLAMDGSGGAPVVVRGVYRAQGGLPSGPGRPWGFSFGGDGGVLGAVQAFGDPSVWLSPTGSAVPRGVLAASSVALLLLEEVRSFVERERDG
jgi:hypothetical protein